MNSRIIAHFAVGLTLLLRAGAAEPPKAQGSDVYVVRFSHLDLYWGGTQEECLSRGTRIIVRAIQLSEQHPEFRFLLEDEVFVANFVASYRGSEELAEFCRLVKEGRIEIAPKWAAIYQNLPRGEALVRNLVYGKQYAREVFGVDPKVAHIGDIPGFTRQDPQILSKSDTPYMVMTRMGPTDHSLFYWRSPDGSSVLVWNTINGYSWGVNLGLHHELNDASFAKISKDIASVQATTNGPVYLGWGTDLWASNETLIDNMKVFNQHLAPDYFRFATPSEFFREAARTSNIPVLSGEIPSSWANLITSMANLWPPAISATDTLLTAEKFAAISYAPGYADYPSEQFSMLWKKALESMDHNNYGQGGYIGDARKVGYAKFASLEGGQILRDSLRNIAERVQRPFAVSTPIVVFNPLSWTRDDVVEAHVTLVGDVAPGAIADYKAGMRLVDEQGASVPFYSEQYSENISRALQLVFVAQQVPSLGYKTYYLIPAAKSDSFSSATNVHLDDANDITNPRRIVGADAMENAFYRVTIDRAMGTVEIFDKDLNRDVLKDAQISASEERGGNSLSIEPRTGRTIINVVHNVALEENSPVRSIIKIEGDIARIQITQRVILYRLLKRIDVEDRIDWHPGRFMKIEQVFPLLNPNAEVRNGVPFGSASLADLMPGAGPHFRDEVPRDIWKGWRQIQYWIAAGSDWTLTIGADHQFFDVSDGAVRGDMLRGIRFNPLKVVRDGKQILIEQPPAGVYTFRYSISSGKGNWSANRSWRIGMDLNVPLIPVTSLNELSRKTLPPRQSFLSFDPDNLVLTEVKKAEPGNGIVARLFEISGHNAETPLYFLGRNRDFYKTNMLEEDLNGGPQKALELHPYEIETVRVPAEKATR